MRKALTGSYDVVLLILKVRTKPLDDKRNGFLSGEEYKTGAQFFYGFEAITVLAMVMVFVKVYA